MLAEKTLVECDTNKVFEDNTCHVCFTDKAESETNVLDITGIKVQWKNEQTDVTEVAYKSENVVPEVITKLTSETTPADAKEAWKFTNPWKDDKEFALVSGEVTFIEMNEDAKITITDTPDELDKTVLVRAPLVFHEWTVFTPLTESDKEQTRNTCILYDTKFGPAPVVPEEPQDEEEEDLELDSAPETDDSSEDTSHNSGDYLPRPTSIEAGPREVLFLLLALSLGISFFFFRKTSLSR